MGNLLCILAHCSGRSEEIIVGDKSHIFDFEQGNVAHVSSLLHRLAMYRAAERTREVVLSLILNVPLHCQLKSRIPNYVRVRRIQNKVSQKKSQLYPHYPPIQ